MSESKNKQLLREAFNAPAMSFEPGTTGESLLGILAFCAARDKSAIEDAMKPAADPLGDYDQGFLAGAGDATWVTLRSGHTYTATLPGRIQPIEITDPDLFKDDFEEEPEAPALRDPRRVAVGGGGVVIMEKDEAEALMAQGVDIAFIVPRVPAGHIQSIVGVDIKYDEPQHIIRHNHVALVDKPPHPAMTIHRPPCPDCAHTEHPGQYWGAHDVETCGTCGGSSTV